MKLNDSIRNVKNNVIYFLITTFLTFFSRKIFIDGLGAELLGLNTLIVSILGFLNILELGIGSAVTYSLYKPIKSDDKKKINEIIYLYKYLYRILALVIFVIGLVIMLFINVIAKDNSPYIKVYFFMYLISVASSYLFTYKFILPTADEKAYIVTKVTGNFKILKNILQIVAIMYFNSYFVWLVFEVISNIAGYIVCNKKIEKQYEYLDLKVDKGIKEIWQSNARIVRDMKNLFYHKIGYIAVYQTDNILLSIFTNLNVVAYYGNYLTIINFITTFMGQVFAAFMGTIGKLVADDDHNKNFSVWRKLFTLEVYIANIITFCVYVLIDEFIGVWIGKEFVLDNAIVILIVINMFVTLTRSTTDNFKSAYGIFHDVKAPLFEAVINLAISLILVVKLGLLGIVIGTFVSNLIIVLIWRPYIVFTEGFKLNFGRYIKLYLTQVIKILIIFSMGIFVNNLLSTFMVTGFISFFIKAGILCMAIGAFTLFSMLCSKYEREVLVSILKIVKLKR